MSDRFSSLPDDDKFASLPDDNEIEPSGNVLQRAVKGFTEIDPRQVGYSVASGNAPSDIGGFLASKFMGRPSGIGNMSTQAEGAREDVVNKIDNPLLRIGTDIVTDPMTYVGISKVPETSTGAFNKTFPYVSKESRVGFTKGVEKSLINRRNALTRGFGSALNRSKATVDLSNVVDPGSEITKFSMKEAQDLKNAISQGIPEAVKKGVRIDPKHFGNRQIAGMISDAMKKADPKMASQIEKYGTHAENFKSAIAPIKSSRGTENIFGSNLIKQMFGAGGSIPEKAQVALEEFAPRTAKEVHGAKINENIFRGLRGATVGTVASKFVPGILKRALLSEATK